MAEALKKLAPPISPSQPPDPAHAGWIDSAGLAAAALAIALMLLWATWKWGIPAWRKWRLKKELDRLSDGPDLPMLAQQVVLLARKYKVQPDDAWWQAIDELRFGRPANSHPRSIADVKSRLLAAGSKHD